MRTPTRRTLLRATAGSIACGALAGCTSGPLRRRYRVESDPVPPALNAAIEAQAILTPNRSHPLVVRITFASRADEPTEYAIEGDGRFPFGRAVAANTDPVEPLVPEGGTPPPTETDRDRDPARVVVAPRGQSQERVDDCWRWTGGSDGDGDAVTLAPGGSTAVEYAVLNHPENEACYPLGTYRFTQTYLVGSSGATSETVPWGFSLAITDIAPRPQ